MPEWEALLVDFVQSLGFDTLAAELADVTREAETGAAMFTEDAQSAGPHVELYDSGSTQHLLPY